MEILKYFAAISFLITVIVGLSVYASSSNMKSLLKLNNAISHKDATKEIVYLTYFIIIFLLIVIVSIYRIVVTLEFTIPILIESLLMILGAVVYQWQKRKVDNEKKKLFFSKELHSGKIDKKYMTWFNLIFFIIIMMISAFFFFVFKKLITEVYSLKENYDLNTIMKIIYNFFLALLNFLLLFSIYDVLNTRIYIKNLTKYVVHGEKIYKSYNVIVCYLIGITEDVYILKPHLGIDVDNNENIIESQVIYITKSKVNLVEMYNEKTKQDCRNEESRVNKKHKKLNVVLICIGGLFVISFPLIFKLFYWSKEYPQWISTLIGYYGALIGGFATLVAMWVTVRETRRIQKNSSDKQEERERVEKIKNAIAIMPMLDFDYTDERDPLGIVREQICEIKDTNKEMYEFNFRIYIKNIGKSVANIKGYNLIVDYSINEDNFRDRVDGSKNIMIFDKASKECEFNYHKEKEKNTNIKVLSIVPIEVIFEDILGNEYKQILVVHWENDQKIVTKHSVLLPKITKLANVENLISENL